MQRSDVHVPANISGEAIDRYIDNYLAFTKGTGRALLFAGDQKIEHLNDDYFGEGIAEDDADPEHLFRIASQTPIGAFASQHGLLSRYAQDYPRVPYIVKMNSRTKLVPGEPLSTALVDIEDVLVLRDAGVNVIGVGYTIYMGSAHEHIMFAEAGRLAAKAHEQGLIVVFWIYPRGSGVPDPHSPKIAAGAAGVGASLGADFVKLAAPKTDGRATADMLTESVAAAGRTGVLVSGGHAVDPGAFLHEVYEHMRVGCAGAAVGRNIHQRPLHEAVRLAKAMAAIIYDGFQTHDAYLVSTGEKDYAR